MLCIVIIFKIIGKKHETLPQFHSQIVELP